MLKFALLPRFPPSLSPFLILFLFPMMTGAWGGGHIPQIPPLDTPLNEPFNSSFNKNRWQVDLCMYVLVPSPPHLCSRWRTVRWKQPPPHYLFHWRLPCSRLELIKTCVKITGLYKKLRSTTNNKKSMQTVYNSSIYIYYCNNVIIITLSKWWI